MLAVLGWVAVSAWTIGSRRADPWPELDRLPHAEQSPGPAESARAEHERHLWTSPASPAAAAIPRKAVDPNVPLPVDGLGRALLDWDVLAATRLERGEPPAFAANLARVDGQHATLVGYMCPLDEVGEMNLFLLLETPVGCFYCQPPTPTGIVLVQLAGGDRTPLRYEPVKITGVFRINRDNPEDFLFSLSEASLSPAD